MRSIAFIIVTLSSLLFIGVTDAQFDWPSDDWTVLEAGEFVQAAIGYGQPVQQYRFALEDDPDLLAVTYVQTDFLARFMRESSIRDRGGGGSDGLLDHSAEVGVHNAHEVAEFRWAMIQPYNYMGGPFSLGFVTYHLEDLPLLRHDSELSGTLSPDMPLQIYRFSGQSGDIVQLSNAPGGLHSQVFALPAYNIYSHSFAPLSLEDHAYTLRVDGDYALVVWTEGESLDYQIIPRLRHEIDGATYHFLRLTEDSPSAEITLNSRAGGPQCLRVEQGSNFSLTAYQGPEAVLEAEIGAGQGASTFTLLSVNRPLRLTLESDQFHAGLMAPPDVADELFDHLNLPEHAPAKELLISLSTCPG